MKPPLYVAWTLFYEIAFYALFSVLILSRAVGTAFLVAWALLILAFHSYAPTNSPVGVWTSFIAINFFIGMGACLLHRRLSGRAAGIVFVLGAVGLFAVGMLIDTSLPIGVCQPLVALSCGAMICGLTGIEARHTLNFGLLAVIGDASYTLYLVHGHVFQVVLKVLQRVGALAVLPPDLVFVLTMALTVGVSIVIYQLTERRIVRAFKRLTRSSATPLGADPGAQSSSIGQRDAI